MIRVDITPELAAAWLANKNQRNRPIRKMVVREYASMMPGAWRLEPSSPICFGKSGRLLNGQHRLRAVVMSGATVPMYIVGDVDDDLQEVMDTGRPWTTADKLAITERKNATCVAAIARMAAGTLTKGASARDGLAFAKQHAEHCEAFVTIMRLPGFGAGVAGAFAKASVYKMRGVHMAAQRLVSLEWSGDGDPMLALTKRLRRANGLHPTIRYAIAVSALKAVHEGRPLVIAKESPTDFEPVDATREAFRRFEKPRDEARGVRA